MSANDTALPEFLGLPADDTVQLTTLEAARVLRVSTQTLERWRSQGIGPAHQKGPGLRSRVTYLAGELRAYVAASRRTSTSDRGGAL
ncbi:MAG TPA: helix-turn-helix domain-containing protein [Hyphomicrobiaceae bacterium]|nr:helix-turn-helix domain-containing protein [Hyphomicrobiaceae bacterium]